MLYWFNKKSLKSAYVAIQATRNRNATKPEPELRREGSHVEYLSYTGIDQTIVPVSAIPNGRSVLLTYPRSVVILKHPGSHKKNNVGVTTDPRFIPFV